MCQRAAGVVINQKINMPRDDYDQLKAILCNCVSTARPSRTARVADFRAHLAGRVAHAVRLNPQRGQKLMGFSNRFDGEFRRCGGYPIAAMFLSRSGVRLATGMLGWS